MAKLSARHRTEIFRLSRKTESGAVCYVALMSDGTILSKYKYPPEIGGSTGWKQTSRPRALTVDDIVHIRAIYREQGYR
jgi:hypothetical protein